MGILKGGSATKLGLLAAMAMALGGGELKGGGIATPKPKWQGHRMGSKRKKDSAALGKELKLRKRKKKISNQSRQKNQKLVRKNGRVIK